METKDYLRVSELESQNKPEAAFQLLCQLAEEEDPMALLEISARYYSTEGYLYPVKHLKPDYEKSKKFGNQAKRTLEILTASGDGEAMRMLANVYLGHWLPFHEKSRDKAEQLLLKAFETGHYFAANDLVTLYLGKDNKKARYWYQEAEMYGCRVIYDPALE